MTLTLLPGDGGGGGVCGGVGGGGMGGAGRGGIFLSRLPHRLPPIGSMAQSHDGTALDF